MNRVVHFEIHAKDMDKSQQFYEQLFGWKFIAMGPDMGNYRVVMTGPGPDEIAGKVIKMEEVGINGGMTPRQGEPAASGAPVNAFVCIVGVDDVDATMAKAQELGGTVALPAMEVPTVGRLGYLKDPDNNIFGVIKPQM